LCECERNGFGNVLLVFVKLSVFVDLEWSPDTV